MSLDIKKVYVDTRWRTSDSKSSTDFSIELPRSFIVPDNVVAYIDDIVLPISFPTIYDRNNTVLPTVPLSYDIAWHNSIRY